MTYRKIAALGGAAAAAVLIAGPSAAQEATIGSPLGCVGGLESNELAPLVGHGFTPNAPVTISANGSTLTTATANANGDLQAAAKPPAIAPHSQRTVQLTAFDGTISAGPTPLRVTRFSVKFPARAQASRRVTFRAFGFLPGRRVYLFVRRHGRTLGRFSLGKAKGPCGNTRRRLPYMPVRRHTSGTYFYFFEQRRRFSTRASRIMVPIRITQVLG